MIKILIISDTHGNDTWKHLLEKDYNYVIHAGDHLMKAEEMERLVDHYVDGNNDWGKLKIKHFKIDVYNILLTHGDEYVGPFGKNLINGLHDLANSHNSDIIIYGHTHIPFVKKVNDVLILNPGSMSFSRNNGKKCYLELIIDNKHEITIKQWIY